MEVLTNSRKPDTENDTAEQDVERLEDGKNIFADGQEESALEDAPRPDDETAHTDEPTLEEPLTAESDDVIDAELEKITEETDEFVENSDVEDRADEMKAEEDAVDATDDEAAETVESEADAEQIDALDAASEDLEGKDPSDTAEDFHATQEQEASEEEKLSDDGDADKMENKPEPRPEPKVEVVQGSMWPGVFGGVIAALVGFVVGRGDVIDQFLPTSLQREAVTLDTSALEAEAAALAAQTAALASQSDAISSQTTELAAQAEALAAQSDAQSVRLDALEVASGAEGSDALDSMTAEIATLTERLAALENQPVELPEELANAASTADVDALQAALDAQKSQIEDLSQRAADAETAAAGEAARLLAQAALMRVMTAVDSGAAFSPVLAELQDVAPVEVPQALQTAAETGVPTLADLQASFPEAARIGLAAARAEVPESDVAGIGGFLKRQLNVRSVTPREGSGPDAVLSRAQAAVDAGNLESALSEAETLPDAAKTAMNDWLEAASARKAAQDAAQELADSLNSN
ncbi:MAG: hypothetical protein AB8B62_04155 [Roseobacter sp.]